jgi:hypothetical protein
MKFINGGFNFDQTKEIDDNASEMAFPFANRIREGKDPLTLGSLTLSN